MSKVDARLIAGQGLAPMGSGGSALIGFADRVRGGTGGGVGITAGDGITARATSYLTQAQLDAIGGDRAKRAKLNRILLRLGDTYIDRIRRIVAGHGAYKTGRFYSSFRQVRSDDDSGAGFNTMVAIVNEATDDKGRQYAAYVHPKGTPRRKTILKEIVRDLVPKMRAELRADLRREFGAVAKARILGAR